MIDKVFDDMSSTVTAIAVVTVMATLRVRHDTVFHSYTPRLGSMTYSCWWTVGVLMARVLDVKDADGYDCMNLWISSLYFSCSLSSW